jgi:hypothetical protein
MESIEKVIIQFSAFEHACPYTMEELTQGSRKRHILYWRQVGQWWYFQECLNKSEVARLFKCDHATIINSIRVVKDALDGYNREMLSMVEDVINCAPYKESKYKFKPHEDMCVNEAISLTLMDNYR